MFFKVRPPFCDVKLVLLQGSVCTLLLLLRYNIYHPHHGNIISAASARMQEAQPGPDGSYRR